MKQFLTLMLAIFCGTALASPPTQIRSVELSDLLRQLMVPTGKAPSKDSYLELNGVFGKLTRAQPSDLAPNGNETFPKDRSDYYYIFHGRINLLAQGKPVATDRLAEDASWKVWVAGPKAMASSVWLASDNASNRDAGPKYLRSRGIVLEPVACSQIGRGNYTAIYHANAPGRRPILLEVTASSGSGGKWYSYHVTWFSMKASELPKDAEVGLCDVDD